MKTSIFNPFKKVAKWYFSKSANNYMWLPTGTLPIIRK